MQEQLELKRAYNRENQRRWREKNLERSKELKKISNWKARGYSQEHIAEKLTERPKSKSSIEAFGTRIDPTDQIDVALCMGCFRKYLPKLYCLWCNDTHGRFNRTRC